ncbi:MAG: dicarboxylate/amino acid:cation symporter [Oscillospiraceae bacterium]|nr:dicarboxylate/amino acid:cation symporter [Oscillospiraceae bacterium]
MIRTSLWKNYRFPVILIASIFVGSITGLLMGEKARILAPLGDIFLNLMFTAVVPLVFVTISSAVGNMTNMKRLGKILGYMLLTFLVTGLIAAVVIIVAVKIFPPASGVEIALESATAGERVSLSQRIVNAVTVNDFSLLLSRSNMLALIVFSVMFGYCTGCIGEDNIVARGLESLSNVMMKLVNLIMLYAPVGLCAYFASLTGQFGPQLLGAYGRAMILYYPLCVVYFFAAFALYSWFAGGKKGVRLFFVNILPPAVTSLATQSSIATLPVNFDAADRIGVSKDISGIVLPIGATMHMDGSVLAAVLKISFLYGIFGKDFSGIDTYIVAVVIAILSGVVLSGVPGGGLVGEMLIVSLMNFPPEAFPLIATIGFLVDPPATCLNACGDTVASMIVNRLTDGKEWLEKHNLSKST